MKKASLLKLMSLYPPYLGAGVRVKEISPDFKNIKVEMKLRFWNKNYVGTHFGGSLYSMIDPFYMLMLMENLGKKYIVWDKAASIRFRRPGRGKVFAHFKLDNKVLESIKKELESKDKFDYDFNVQVLDEDGQIVADAIKTLYIANKKTS